MRPTSVSILGCGWLGLPLAKQLVTRGFSVKGSTTSQGKLPVLKKLKIEPFLIHCGPPLSGENIPEFFSSKILFLNIPFRRNFDPPTIYKQQIDTVVKCLHSSSIEFVIFASSTAVYPKNLQEAKEDIHFTPNNPRSQVLCKIEQTLLNDIRFQTTVIRFAGLYGGDRQIGNFLRTKSSFIENGPANLIHLDDCVGIIEGIIQKNIRGEILNACSDVHPLKEVLYSKAARNLGLEPPLFDKSSQTSSKIVTNEKIKTKLGYHFKHPNPMDDC